MLITASCSFLILYLHTYSRANRREFKKKTKIRLSLLTYSLVALNFTSLFLIGNNEMVCANTVSVSCVTCIITLYKGVDVEDVHQ